MSQIGDGARCTSADDRGGRNASERRASLEKVVAQADPTLISGKVDSAGRSSKQYSSRCAGVVATACTQGKRTQHGKPLGVIEGDQLDAREGESGRLGVAERSVLPMKPGNAGGGKGPQVKTGAGSGKAQEIGATRGNSVNVRELRKAPHAEAKEELGVRSGKRMTAQAVALVVMCRKLGCCTPGSHGPVLWME